MRGLYLAEAAMLTQQAKLNLISHNLANQRTAGYKGDELAQTSFNEWLICCRQSIGQPAVSRSSYQPVGSMSHSVAVGEIRTDLTPGPIQETGRELDFALNSGYFTVQSQDGLIYTRNGRFFLNQEGYLVTADNLPVLGESGMIQLTGPEISVDRDGIIYNQGQQLDRLRISIFSPEARLEKVGDNYFRLLNEPEVLEQGTELYWRCLENSNVDLTREMVSMLQVRRSFEAAQKIMASYDQLLNRAANELGALS